MEREEVQVGAPKTTWTPAQSGDMRLPCLTRHKWHDETSRAPFQVPRQPMAAAFIARHLPPFAKIGSRISKILSTANRIHTKQPSFIRAQSRSGCRKGWNFVNSILSSVSRIKNKFQRQICLRADAIEWGRQMRWSRVAVFLWRAFLFHLCNHRQRHA